MPAPVDEKPLVGRDTEVNLERDLGKTSVVSAITPLEQRGGFYCETCQCLLKDSLAYLDHINGKNRASFGCSGGLCVWGVWVRAGGNLTRCAQTIACSATR